MVPLISCTYFFPIFSENFRISANPAKAFVNQRSPVRLTCKVSYPSELLEPETFWIFNNTRIHEKSALQYYTKSYGPREGTNSTKMVLFQLQISNVSDQYVGWYICAADFKIIIVKAGVSVTLEGEEADGMFQALYVLCTYGISFII